VISVLALLERLAQRGQTVAVAESLTGGELIAMLTEPPGASRVVRGGLVVYATDSKTSLAGVDAALLAEVGPVSAAVAKAMAEGARATLAASYGVGVTGVAGPDSQDGHPVGEVHIAVAGPGGVVAASPDLRAAGGRSGIRRAACESALGLLDTVSREAAP